MTDHVVYTLEGVVAKGEGWAARNWSDVVSAHELDVPDLRAYLPGTLNFNLVVPSLWVPPRRVSLAKRKKVCHWLRQCEGRVGVT